MNFSAVSSRFSAPARGQVPSWVRRAPSWVRRSGLVGALALAAALLPAAGALAADFPVTTTADSGTGSLRAAMVAANAQAGADSISIRATGTINLESALPRIVDQDVAISGPGQEALTVRRNAAAPFRIFEIDTAAVSFSDLTISNGRAEFFGGGIISRGPLSLTRVTVRDNEAFSNGGEVALAESAGISTLGFLKLRETTVTGNKSIAAGGTVSTIAVAAGIGAFRGIQIVGSTVSGNVARANGASGETKASGAGLLLDGGPFSNAMTIDRSTISGNSAVATGGAGKTTVVGDGGGISADEGLTVTSSTITANSVSGEVAQGANLLAISGKVRNTIVSNPRGATSCRDPLVSEGFNIEDGSSCGLAQPTDLSGVDPGLDPNLAANGGPTQTHALLAGSVAIDRGNAFGATLDQRGSTRPSDSAIANAAGGDGSDVGAFEVQFVAVADRAAPQTRILRGPQRRTTKRLAIFRFSSNEPGSSFECKLDRQRFRRCASPFKRKVKAGPRRGAKHVLLVRARDAAGNVDATPAKYVWRVRRVR
jgi:hypothetical protein